MTSRERKKWIWTLLRTSFWNFHLTVLIKCAHFKAQKQIKKSSPLLLADREREREMYVDTQNDTHFKSQGILDAFVQIFWDKRTCPSFYQIRLKKNLGVQIRHKFQVQWIIIRGEKGTKIFLSFPAPLEGLSKNWLCSLSVSLSPSLLRICLAWNWF